MSGDVPSAGDLDGEVRFEDQQEALDEDQTLSDRDQTLSDSDQTSADRDQTAAERDQFAADRDQLAADLDRAARPAGESDDAYLLARAKRWRSAADRDMSMTARSESARRRHALAENRDAVADWRDKVAAMRDEMAATLDQQDDAFKIEAADAESRVSKDHLHGVDLLMNAARDRHRAASNRKRAAAHREAAAKDRAHAAEDRREAALDRAAAEAELLSHGTDHLTGTLRRHVGLNAMQREWDRSERAQETFVAAFIDVDGLKATNSQHGHKAGDRLLQAVTRCIKTRLRSYDLIARYGGDEFIVTISGQDVVDVRTRFEHIAAQLALEMHGASMSIGLADRQSGDTLDGLIERADAAMRAGRNGG
jgi:diguanylate cyclase (GGDEF)-like protein